MHPETKNEPATRKHAKMHALHFWTFNAWHHNTHINKRKT